MSKTENSFVSGIKIVFTDRDFGTIFISLFIIGLSVGGFMPYLTVWATNTLHATSFQAGFLFVPMSIIGLIVSFYLASLSDKWGETKAIYYLGVTDWNHFKSAVSVYAFLYNSTYFTCYRRV
ncbi:MFS transporter [Priestia aryabhattai]|uniref:MFS transporter n=1 Tax=Priestia aryabhattai TaxID=412384 RepID=UPI001D0B3E04|nr:MFS transporter [Priestia aryabhattai]